MRAAYRVIAVLLGLAGASRVLYASLASATPWMSEPTPVANTALGLLVLVAAGGLFLGYGWSRWPAVAATVVVMLQDLAFLVWALDHDADLSSVASSLIGPIAGVGMLFVLLRRWPAGVPWSERVP